MVYNGYMDTMKTSQESGVKGQEKSKIPQTPNPEPRTIFWGIRAQLIAGITVVTVGAIALLGVLSIKMLEWNALYRKGKEAEVIGMFIQVLVKNGQGITESNLKGFVAGMTENGLIKNMAIIDEKGEAIFITGEGIAIDKDEGRTLFSISGLNIKMIGGGWFQGIGKEIQVSVPLRRGSGIGGQGSGSIIFSMSLADIREEGANFRRFIFFYALFDSVIIIVLGIYLFSRGIIRPMQNLKETTEGIAKGMLEKRVDIKAGGELGSFAASFNIMADRLEEKIKTLERLNKDLMNTQEELVRSEKLATVGRLAAGVAHEIGNPLGAMLGYVDILKKQESEVRSLPPSVSIGGQESGEILKRLEKEIARIDTIVRRLLDFSRPSKVVLHDVDVNKVVRDSVTLFSPQFSDIGISFDIRLDEALPHILMDEGMLHQVLLNLFLNAKDAIEGSGTIIVEAGVTDHGQGARFRRRKNDSADKNFTNMHTEALGRRSVVISVTDSGKGIAESDIGKIFDPFFTTKEQGKGTGLGLAVSLGIVHVYNGDIKVKSALGRGTTFKVFLPIEEKRR
jgi:signal transduction histidine kinase